MDCPECGAENPESAKFCNECGEALPGAEDKGSDRFTTVVAFLIAIVSIVGAILAYRVTLAAGAAADEDVAGVVSSLNIHQARVASQADLYRDLSAFLQVRIHNQLSRDLIEQRNQYPDDDPIRTQLWDEAWTETFVAESYQDKIYISPEYLRSDGSYDQQAALDISIAHWALESDFNRDRHFDEADRLRTRVQWLMVVAFVLALVLFFYTLAEVITHPLKYLLVGLGSAIFVVAIVAMIAIEVFMA